MITRRHFMGCGALLATTLLAGGKRGWATPPAYTIELRSSPDGSDVWFDPLGLWVPVGAVIRWSNGADQTNTHTTSAYHPANGNHARRIPRGARPWESGYLLPGQSFKVRLTVSGVYDYYCRPHEEAGMVGRIVVGHPSGKAAKGYDDPPDRHHGWLPVPAAALATFPDVAKILARRVIQR